MVAVVTIIGVVSSIGTSQAREVLERAKVVRAIGDLRTVNQELNQLDSLPVSLAAIGRGSLRDPWGRPYRYLKFPPSRRGNAPPSGARKDRFLVPINSRFDLYSVGRDGLTKAPLTAQASRDDIVVANDGGFIGRAVDY